LAQPGLGLAAAVWRDLSQVDAVVHCAGEVDLLRPYEHLRPTLVQAVAEVLRLCAEGRAKRLVHVSTLAVFALSDQALGRHLPNPTLNPRRVLLGGYAQAKWAAEALVTQAAGLAATVTIARLGLLVGPAPPHGDWLALVLGALARLGCLPQGDPGWRLDTTPVADAAHAMLAFAAQDAGTTPQSLRVCHVAGAPAGLDDLAAGLALAGQPMVRVSLATFRRRLAERAAGNADAAILRLALARAWASRFHQVGVQPTDLFLATGVDFAADVTRAALGLAAPPPSAGLLALCARAQPEVCA